MLVYLLILAAKIIEISMMTFRYVMITKGERLIGSVIGFFEVMLWLLIVSNVLTNISEDPIKIFVYALGFAIGIYVGGLIEEKIGIGTVRIEAIVASDYDMANKIREKGYAVTVVEGKGMNYDRVILILNVRRKESKKVIATIMELDKDAVITTSDIKPINGGYGMLRR